MAEEGQLRVEGEFSSRSAFSKHFRGEARNSALNLPRRKRRRQESRIRHLCGDKTDGIRDHPGSESFGAAEEFRLIHEKVADNVAAAGDADDIGAVRGEDSFGENLR